MHDAADKFLHTAGLSTRINTAHVQPYAAFIFSLDDEVNNDLPFVFTFGLAAVL